MLYFNCIPRLNVVVFLDKVDIVPDLVKQKTLEDDVRNLLASYGYYKYGLVIPGSASCAFVNTNYKLGQKQIETVVKEVNKFKIYTKRHRKPSLTDVALHLCEVGLILIKLYYLCSNNEPNFGLKCKLFLV